MITQIVRVLLVFFFFRGVSWAGSHVLGQYKAGSDGAVKILLQVQQRPPVAFIVLQHIPNGMEAQAVSPSPTGYTKGKKTVKWLFKRPQPGRMILSMKFSRPVSVQRLSGEIRYRNPMNGKLVIKPIGH